MENINFIPANNLPIAEGDEVSVLCVEGGELKQKPASGLGGGNEKPVAIIEAIPNGSGWISSAELLSGSYAAIKEKLDEGVMPSIIVKYANPNEEGFAKPVSVAVAIENGMICVYAILGGIMSVFGIGSDNTVSVYETAL